MPAEGRGDGRGGSGRGSCALAGAALGHLRERAVMGATFEAPRLDLRGAQRGVAPIVLVVAVVGPAAGPAGDAVVSGRG